jgi:hypothetical protein
MCIRDPRVLSAYVDLIDKDVSYRKHMNAVSRARTVLNTENPIPSRRLHLTLTGMTARRRHLLQYFQRPTYLQDEISTDLYELRFSPRTPRNPALFPEIKSLNQSQSKGQTPPSHSSPPLDALEYSDEEDIPDPSDSSSSDESISDQSWQPRSPPPSPPEEIIRIGYEEDEFGPRSLSEHFRRSALQLAASWRSSSTSPRRSPGFSSASSRASSVAEIEDISDPSDTDM